MPWPRTLVLVRHAESEGNVLTADQRAEYDIGTHEYALTERGRKQAEITGQYLRSAYGVFDARYVSYYVRSKETMAIMCPNEKVYEDPRLAEAQRGIWHTMTGEQIALTYPGEVVRKKREGLYHYRPWGGENWPDVELRVHSFLSTLHRDYEDKSVVIVVHGHWKILFQRLVDRLSIEEVVRRYDGRDLGGELANASVTTYTTDQSSKRPRLTFAGTVVPWEGVI